MPQFTSYDQIPKLPRIHLVREDESSYAPSPSPKPGRHRTMIEDQVVEAVAFACGAAALGIYVLLERRVDKQGQWTCTIASLAQSFQCSERHVRDALERLEQDQFIKREVVASTRGLALGVRFTLPNHGGMEPTSDPTPEATNEPSRARSRTSSYQVDTSKSSPLPPKGDLDGFDDWYRGYPRKVKRLEAESAWRKLPIEDRVAALFGLTTFPFSDDPKYIPLPASWLNGKRWTDEAPAPRKVPIEQLPPALKKRYDTVVQERTALGRSITPLPEKLQADIDDWKRSQSV